MSQRLLSKYLWEEQCQWKKMRENCTLMFARGLCHFATVCGILLKSEIPVEIFALKSRKIYNTQKCNRKLIFIETQVIAMYNCSSLYNSNDLFMSKKTQLLMIMISILSQSIKPSDM